MQGVGMSRDSWWMYGVVGLVALVGGVIVMTQTAVVGVGGMGGAIVALGLAALGFAVHYKPEPGDS